MTVDGLDGMLRCRANLSTAQIVEQVVAARRLLAADGASAEGGITNVVFMVRTLWLTNLPVPGCQPLCRCSINSAQQSHSSQPPSPSSSWAFASEGAQGVKNALHTRLMLQRALAGYGRAAAQP